MQRFFISLLLFTTLVTGSPPDFFESNSNFEKWLVKPSQTETENILLNIKHIDLFELLYQQIERGFLDVKNNIYFIDLDNDGIMEIYYAGYLAGESLTNVFLKKNGNTYEVIDVFFGDIFWANSNSAKSYLNFVIYNHACCAGTAHYVEEYIFQTKTNKTDFILIDYLAFNTQTDFPKSLFENSIVAKNKNESKNIRFTFAIDDTCECWPEDKYGNTVAKLQKGAIYTVLSKTNSWLFIRVNEKFLNESSFYRGSNTDEPFDIYGWIKYSQQ
jgi:hypothetical protein